MGPIVNFSVTDGKELVSENAIITVTAANRASIGFNLAQTVTGEMVRITLSATDDDGDVLTYATNATFGTRQR